MFFLFQKFSDCLQCYFTGSFSGVVVITCRYAGESLNKRKCNQNVSFPALTMVVNSNRINCDKQIL